MPVDPPWDDTTNEDILNTVEPAIKYNKDQIQLLRKEWNAEYAKLERKKKNYDYSAMSDNMKNIADLNEAIKKHERK